MLTRASEHHQHPGLNQDIEQRVKERTAQLEVVIKEIETFSYTVSHDLRAPLRSITGFSQVLIEDNIDKIDAQGRNYLQRHRSGHCPQVTANGDPRLLRMMLHNLLDNARKFTRKQVSARIEFGVTQQDNPPAYFVRDNGAGFNMAYAGKLFGVFQRLHEVKDFDGNGLATVQCIVNRHGGQIWTEGNVEQGATFYFTLGKP